MKKQALENKAAELWYTYQPPEDVTKPNQKFWQQYDALINEAQSKKVFVVQEAEKALPIDVRVFEEETDDFIEKSITTLIGVLFAIFILVGLSSDDDNVKSGANISFWLLLIVGVVIYFSWNDKKKSQIAIEPGSLMLGNRMMKWGEIKSAELYPVEDFYPRLLVHTWKGEKVVYALKLMGADVDQCVELLERCLGEKLHKKASIMYEDMDKLLA